MFDVAIVGGGPAGSTLALRLRRLGRSVVLLDGAPSPRDKPCGEGIQPAGVAALRALGLADGLAPLATPFEGIRYALPSGVQAEARFPGGVVGWGVPRRELDAWLLEQAREEGVDVRLGGWVRGFERTRRGVRIAANGRDVEAALLIGADGGRSMIRRAAGLELPRPTHGRYGVVGHFRHAPRRDPFVEVFVGDGVELYTTPVGAGLTCAALLVEERHLGPLQGRLEDALRERLAEAGPRGEALAAGVRVGPVRALGPLGLAAKAAHADRLLLVGDAAGALDPITGEGLAIGLVTGEAAAEIADRALATGDLSARALATWTRRRAAAVRPLAALTGALLRVATRPALAGRVVRSLAAAPATFERVLGVASGLAPLSSLTLRDGVRVLLGV